MYYLPIVNFVGHSHLVIVNLTFTFIYRTNNMCMIMTVNSFMLRNHPSLARSQAIHASSFCSRKNRRRRPGAFYYVICGIDDVTGSKHKDMFILMSSATATKIRQVPAERPILPLEHIWV